MQTTRDSKFGPEPPEVAGFYAGVLAAAGPGASLDYSIYITIPEVVWSDNGIAKRLALTYPMREFAQRYGQTPAQAFANIVTPDMRLAMQQNLIATWEGIVKTSTTDVAWLQALIDEMKAKWTLQAQAANPNAPLPPPVVVPTTEPPKPQGWDSTYKVVHTPFGDQWQKG